MKVDSTVSMASIVLVGVDANDVLVAWMASKLLKKL